jgi:hypothetical protein
MDGSKVAAKDFLGPATNNVDLTVIIENFFHSAAIADPVKHSAPKTLLVLGNAPATTSGLADKGVKVVLLFSAFVGVESDRAQASAFEGQIEIAGAIQDERLGSSN